MVDAVLAKASEAAALRAGHGLPDNFIAQRAYV